MAGPDRRKMILNALISVADPEIRRLAEKLAREVPEESPLRSPLAERVLGALKALVESSAEGMHPVPGALVEKLTDLMDFSGTTLFSKNDPPADVKARAEVFLKEAEQAVKRRQKRRRSKKRSDRLTSFLDKANKAIVGTPEGKEALHQGADQFLAEQLKQWKGR